MKTVIRLNGQGGELDVIVLDECDAASDVIRAAVIKLVNRCTLVEGDTITITEEA